MNLSSLADPRSVKFSHICIPYICTCYIAGEFGNEKTLFVGANYEKYEQNRYIARVIYYIACYYILVSAAVNFRDFFAIGCMRTCALAVNYQLARCSLLTKRRKAYIYIYICMYKLAAIILNYGWTKATSARRAERVSQRGNSCWSVSGD